MIFNCAVPFLSKVIQLNSFLWMNNTFAENNQHCAVKMIYLGIVQSLLKLLKFCQYILYIERFAKILKIFVMTVTKYIKFQNIVKKSNIFNQNISIFFLYFFNNKLLFIKIFFVKKIS